MKRYALLCTCLALFCAAMPAAFAQDDIYMPAGSAPMQPMIGTDNGSSIGLAGSNPDGLIAPNPSANGTATPTVPIWSYNVAAYDGNTYHGTIVGRSPFTRGARTTSVPTVIVPVRFTFIRADNSLSAIEDPTASDSDCLGGTNTAVSLDLQSPLLQPFNFVYGGVNVGFTTYQDANQRAQFWQSVQATGNAYHLALNPVTVKPVQDVSFNTGTAPAKAFVFGGQCGLNKTTTGVNRSGYLGVVDINVWDTIAQTMITNLGLGPTQFPIFVFYDVVLSNGPPRNDLANCCFLGYHNSLGPDVDNPGQTYAIAEFEGRNQTLFTGTADVSVLSHEIQEWVDDPSGVNRTPRWGHLGQVGGCQGNLEEGDPLSGTLLPAVQMPNGFNYHLQEIPFFSWFFTDTSYGVNNWFSSNNTFKGRAKACPPGGTF